MVLRVIHALLPAVKTVDKPGQTAKMMQEQTIHGYQVKTEHSRDDDWSNLLVQVGSNRDRKAFERLFHHFAPLIKGFHHSRSSQVLSPEAADELVQEVMFRVWRKAPSFDPRKASANTWVYTIMRNCRIDFIRRNSRHVVDSEVEVDDIWDESPESQPFAVLQKSRNERDVAMGLRSLPAEQGHVIEKAYIEGKSHSEIAEELGLPLGTVKSRVRLALKKLHSVIKRAE